MASAKVPSEDDDRCILRCQLVVAWQGGSEVAG